MRIKQQKTNPHAVRRSERKGGGFKHSSRWTEYASVAQTRSAFRPLLRHFGYRGGMFEAELQAIPDEGEDGSR